MRIFYKVYLFIFVYTSVLSAYMSMHHAHALPVETREKVVDVLILKLQMALSHYVEAGNQAQKN